MKYKIGDTLVYKKGNYLVLDRVTRKNGSNEEQEFLLVEDMANHGSFLEIGVEEVEGKAKGSKSKAVSTKKSATKKVAKKPVAKKAKKPAKAKAKKAPAKKAKPAKKSAPKKAKKPVAKKKPAKKATTTKAKKAPAKKKATKKVAAKKTTKKVTKKAAKKPAKKVAKKSAPKKAKKAVAKKPAKKVAAKKVAKAKAKKAPAKKAKPAKKSAAKKTTAKKVVKVKHIKEPKVVNRFVKRPKPKANPNFVFDETPVKEPSMNLIHNAFEKNKYRRPIIDRYVRTRPYELKAASVYYKKVETPKLENLISIPEIKLTAAEVKVAKATAEAIKAWPKDGVKTPGWQAPDPKELAKEQKEAKKLAKQKAKEAKKAEKEAAKAAKQKAKEMKAKEESAKPAEAPKAIKGKKATATVAATKSTKGSAPIENPDVVVLGDDKKSFKKESKAIAREQKRQEKETAREAKETFKKAPKQDAKANAKASKDKADALQAKEAKREAKADAKNAKKLAKMEAKQKRKAAKEAKKQQKQAEKEAKLRKEQKANKSTNAKATKTKPAKNEKVMKSRDTASVANKFMQFENIHTKVDSPKRVLAILKILFMALFALMAAGIVVASAFMYGNGWAAHNWITAGACEVAFGGFGLLCAIELLIIGSLDGSRNTSLYRWSIAFLMFVFSTVIGAVALNKIDYSTINTLEIVATVFGALVLFDNIFELATINRQPSSSSLINDLKRVNYHDDNNGNVITSDAQVVSVNPNLDIIDNDPNISEKLPKNGKPVKARQNAYKKVKVNPAPMKSDVKSVKGKGPIHKVVIDDQNNLIMEETSNGDSWYDEIEDFSLDKNKNNK